MTKSEKPTLKELVPGLLANYAGRHFDVGIANAASRLPILYKSGRIQKSLEIVRQSLDISILDIEEDFYPGPDNGDINIWNTSRFFTQLSEDKTKRLMESVIGELRQLRIPLTLIENYITALLYDSEIKPTLLPTTMFGDLFLVDKFRNLNLTTQDKKFLKKELRAILEIPTNGSIPKDKLLVWKQISKIISGAKNTSRRYRAGKLKLAALENKKSDETDVILFGRLNPDIESDFDELAEKDRKGSQNLRKHRQRLRG